MQAKWHAWMEKFAALSVRERLLIMAAVFAVAYQLADLLLLDRQYQQIERLNREIAQDNAAIKQIAAELNLLSIQAQDDPNRRLRAEIELARDAVRQLQQRLQAVTSEMISPQDMARFLEQLLLQDEQLTMLRLQTLNARPLLLSDTQSDARSDTAADRQPALHRHGFEIEFSGGYMATLHYLQALEGLPWRFFWDSVDYRVIDYPQSVVRLKLHTLSLSEDWIGV